jgi:uncharacterized protein
MRSSAAVLLVGVLVGCGHGNSSASLHPRVATTTKATPPLVCRLPSGEEPNCSCEEGDCAAKIGVLYADEHRDIEARRLFDHACSLHSALGCNNLATLILAGRGGPREPTSAAHLFDAACRGEDPSACYNLGVLYEEGDGVTHDSLVGAELLQQSCKLGMAHACTSLGLVFVSGLTGSIDHERARELFARGCDGGDGEGCTLLAASYARDRDHARELLLKGCDAGDPHACEQIR